MEATVVLNTDANKQVLDQKLLWNSAYLEIFSKQLGQRIYYSWLVYSCICDDCVARYNYVCVPCVWVCKVEFLEFNSVFSLTYTVQVDLNFFKHASAEHRCMSQVKCQNTHAIMHMLRNFTSGTRVLLFTRKTAHYDYCTNLCTYQ